MQRYVILILQILFFPEAYFISIQEIELFFRDTMYIILVQKSNYFFRDTLSVFKLIQEIELFCQRHVMLIEEIESFLEVHYKSKNRFFFSKTLNIYPRNQIISQRYNVLYINPRNLFFQKYTLYQSKKSNYFQ